MQNDVTMAGSSSLVIRVLVGFGNSIPLFFTVSHLHCLHFTLSPPKYWAGPL